MAPSPQTPSRPAEINAPSNHKPSHTASILIGVLLALAIIIVLSLFALYFLRRRRAHNLGEAPPSFLPFANPFKSRGPAYSRNYPARGGVLGWAQGTFRKLRSGRTARGAYEGTSGTGGTGVGRTRSGRFQALDPDEAWDSRVGGEADVYGDPSHTAYSGAGGQGHGGYYEEQELGLAHHQRAGSEVYGYAPTRGLDDDEHETLGGPGGVRGKSVLDERFDEEMEGSGSERASRHDPFGDATAERSSMRGVSPRPMEVDTGYAGARGDRVSAMSGVGSRGSLDESPTERRSVFREDV